MPVAIVLAIAGAWYMGWFESYTYRAEIGYYEADRQEWFVGSDKSREECTSEAIRRFNAMNTPPLGKPGRAFSWACRKMQGDKFMERVR